MTVRVEQAAGGLTCDFCMVGRTGFEPVTSSVSECRSGPSVPGLPDP